MGRTARSRQRESRPKRMLGFSHRPPKSEDAFVTKPERWPFLKVRLIRQSGEVIESGLGNQKLSLFCLHPCAQCVPDSQNKNAGRTRMGTHTRMALFTDLPGLPNEPTTIPDPVARPLVGRMIRDKWLNHPTHEGSGYSTVSENCCSAPRSTLGPDFNLGPNHRIPRLGLHPPTTQPLFHRHRSQHDRKR